MRSVDELKSPSLYRQFNKDYQMTYSKDVQVKYKDQVYIFNYIKKSEDIYELLGVMPNWTGNSVEVLANKDGEPCYTKAVIKSVQGKLYLHFC